MGSNVKLYPYKMNNKKLQIEQLERKLKYYSSATEVIPPPTGWIKAIRTTLGMSLQQLADKLSITRQGMQQIEQRESEGSITIRSLRETANALDMDLVYGLVPKDGSLEALIEKRAHDLAARIVSRTSYSMKLEDQENSRERLQKAMEERVVILKNDLPKVLWD